MFWIFRRTKWSKWNICFYLKGLLEAVYPVVTIAISCRLLLIYGSITGYSNRSHLSPLTNIVLVFRWVHGISWQKWCVIFTVCCILTLAFSGLYASLKCAVQRQNKHQDYYVANISEEKCRSSGAKRFLFRTLLKLFVILPKCLFKKPLCPRNRSSILIYHIITRLVIVHNILQVRCIWFFTC